VEEIAERLPHGLNLPPDRDIVLLALRQLKQIHLLTGELRDSASNEPPSRRELVRKFASFGAAAAALLPAVTSIIAPTPAMAESGDDHTSGMGNNDDQGDNDDQGNNEDDIKGKGQGKKKRQQ
jgi:hypothetical protein